MYVFYSLGFFVSLFTLHMSFLNSPFVFSQGFVKPAVSLSDVWVHSSGRTSHNADVILGQVTRYPEIQTQVATSVVFF
jgi:hypothetical protein